MKISKKNLKSKISESLCINGNYFFTESIDVEEGFGRREIKETPIAGGKYIHLEKGQYIPRKFTFNTHITYPPDKVGQYNEEFKSIQNQICEITSREFGVFNGYVQIVPKYSYAGACELQIKVTEVTDEVPTPEYVSPIDTQKADEEARKSIGADAVSNKSTKKKDSDKKNSNSKTTKKNTKSKK